MKDFDIANSILDDGDSSINKKCKEIENDGVTLDSWKPSAKQPDLVQSQWRKNAIGHNFNQMPELDDFLKIKKYLKKHVSDAEIMNAFGISAETLIAIKKDKYCPVDGILLDTQEQKYEAFKIKIYDEFRKTKSRVQDLMKGLNFIVQIVISDEEDKQKFKVICKDAPRRKPKKDIAA